MTAAWAAAYVGIPWEELDCWEFVAKILREQFQIELALYGPIATRAEEDEIRRMTLGEESPWQEVKLPPRVGDCLLFDFMGRLHIGVVVSENEFISSRGRVDSCLERYDRGYWSKHLIGAWRHESQF